MVEPFYLSHEEFWEWFNNAKKTGSQTTNRQQRSTEPFVKKQKTKHKQEDFDISATTRKRYICLYGKHRPGKKTKVWEGDGYLSITTSDMGHLCDLKGRLLEDPTVMEEVNFESGDEILIGDTEVQIIELDET